MNVKKAAAVALTLIWLVLSRPLPATSQPGIVVTDADSVHSTSFSWDLPDPTPPIGLRIIVEYADSTAPHILADRPPVGPVNDRIIIEYAASTHLAALVYPRELISDTIPPIITEVSASELTTETATITWTTDEFADSQVYYGLHPGSYTGAAQDPLYIKDHVVTLSDLASGTAYHYVVRSTDRSENAATSPEYSFTTLSSETFAYLPIVLRNQ